MILVLTSLIQAASQSSPLPSKNPLPDLAQGKSGIRRTNGTQVVELPFLETLRKGGIAESRGDYAEAERQYKEFVDAIPNAPLGYRRLAVLYDRMGRLRDSYIAYARSLAIYEPQASSMRSDPGPFARYGDLALRFGTVQEAKSAYALAVATSSRDDIWDPRPMPRSDSLASLKAAAHTAAAIVNYWGGGSSEGVDAARRELALALAADPEYWVLYYYRADLDREAGDREAEIHDLSTAERLAPSKGRRQVRWVRMTRHIPDLSGRFLAFPARRDSLSWTEPPTIADPPAVPAPSQRTTTSVPSKVAG